MSASQAEHLVDPLENQRQITRAPDRRIIPPLNFCPVEKQLYRSGQPSIINQLFLQQLHLKTILWLASEEPMEDFLDYCLAQNINIEFVGMINDYNYTNINPWDSLDERTIQNALELICNKENYPLLVCCGMDKRGGRRTSRRMKEKLKDDIRIGDKIDDKLPLSCSDGIVTLS